METTLYGMRNTEDLAEHYLRHVDAMTRERLHEKSAIAAELAWRDAEIDRLRDALAKVVSQIKAHDDHDDRPQNFYRCGWDFDVRDAELILEGAR